MSWIGADLNDSLLMAEIHEEATMSDGDVLLVVGAKDSRRARSVVAPHLRVQTTLLTGSNRFTRSTKMNSGLR